MPHALCMQKPPVHKNEWLFLKYQHYRVCRRACRKRYRYQRAPEERRRESCRKARRRSRHAARRVKHRGYRHSPQHRVWDVIEKALHHLRFYLAAKDHYRQHSDKVGHARHYRDVDDRLHIHEPPPPSSAFGKHTAPKPAAMTAQIMMEKPCETPENTGMYLSAQLIAAESSTTASTPTAFRAAGTNIAMNIP